jgi:hypothetical protein
MRLSRDGRHGKRRKADNRANGTQTRQTHSDPPSLGTHHNKSLAPHCFCHVSQLYSNPLGGLLRLVSGMKPVRLKGRGRVFLLHQQPPFGEREAGRTA